MRFGFLHNFALGQPGLEFCQLCPHTYVMSSPSHGARGHTPRGKGKELRLETSRRAFQAKKGAVLSRGWSQEWSVSERGKKDGGVARSREREPWSPPEICWGGSVTSWVWSSQHWVLTRAGDLVFESASGLQHSWQSRRVEGWRDRNKRVLLEDRRNGPGGEKVAGPS